MKHLTHIFGSITLLTIMLLFVNQHVNAQSGPTPNWQINLNTGTSIFFGDIKQYRIWPISNYENEWRFGGGLTVSRQFSSVFGLRGQGIYGQLSGTRRSWNRYFQNDYFELNLNTTINLNNLIGTSRDDRFVNFYFTAGVGLLNYNSTLYTLNTKKKVAEQGNGNGKGIGGRTLEGILTGGFGVDFRLNNNWSINLESTNRIMNSDKLDTWVSGFPYDVYNYTSIGISYRFGINKNTKGITTSSYQRTVPTEEFKVEPSEKKITTTENQPVHVPVPVVVPEKKPVEVVVPPIEKKAKTKPKVVIVHKQQPKYKTIEYRVQIRARYNRPLKKSYLSAKYNIPISDIMENMHNGYYVYTVGSFNTYEQAKAKRNSLRTHNGVSDAFVVAFKNGLRLDKLP